MPEQASYLDPVSEVLRILVIEPLAAHAKVEEHQRAGGFGSAVLEVASRLPKARAQVRVLGIPDRYVEHMTTREEQLAAAGIDADAIERTVRTLLQPKLV